MPRQPHCLVKQIVGNHPLKAKGSLRSFSANSGLGHSQIRWFGQLLRQAVLRSLHFAGIRSAILALC